MAQKPLAMEQVKQILQLYNDGVSIREITRRVGISRNSVRKYLSRLNNVKQNLSDQALADKAYDNDLIELEAERLRQLTVHFNTAGTELPKPVLRGSCCGRNTWLNILMGIAIAGIVIILASILKTVTCPCTWNTGRLI